MNDKKTICLNMIVRNESRVIARCLNSVKSIIDSWVIVDTGSTDGTQQIIKECLKEIPGELHERPWVDFSHNRTEAFRLAKNRADYTLLIDADEELVFEPGFQLPDFAADAYVLDVHFGISHFHREMLISNRLNWYWEGILHEQITCEEVKKHALNVSIIRGVINRSHPDGHRNLQGDKFRKDAALLEEALAKDPNNSRYMFYLGQSYAQCEQWELAKRAYKRRAAMGGWDQEIYHSLYMYANMQEVLEEDPALVIDSYAKAHQYRPIRAEPLGRIGLIYIRNSNFALAYILAKYAKTIPFPEKESMFVEKHVYDYGLDILIMDSALQLSYVQEAIDTAEKILKVKGLPEQTRKSIKENLPKLNPPKKSSQPFQKTGRGSRS